MRSAASFFAILFVGILSGGGAAWWYQERKIIDWKAKIEKQQRDTQIAHEQHNREVVNGWDSAVNYLRGRLAGGWRPQIPRGSTVPASDLPDTSIRADGQAAHDVLAARRELAACAADKERLIMDGAETTLQLTTLQEWVRGVTLIGEGNK